jgi:ubiquinone/menaquinone biosynthesis C-methylase UbiE
VEETRRFFDTRAEDYYQSNYDQPRDRHAYNLTLRREACLELLPRTAREVLDLGCGPGAMTIPMIAAGHAVVSTDLSFQMVAATAARVRDLGQTPQVAVANAIALPFRDARFDAVVTTGVLEYVQDLRAALREIARVLRPGAVAIVTMSLPRRFERLATGALARLLRRPRVHQTILDRAAFDRVVESVGLQIDERRCCTFAPFPLDVVWPAGVLWIDRNLGGSLNSIDLACRHAKTYLVRAHRP